MEVSNFFVGDDGHLRSGWRATFFLAVFLVVGLVFQGAAAVLTWVTSGMRTGIWVSTWPFLIGSLVLLGAATLVGWGCGAVFEELPFRAFGWSAHRGWLRNVALGSLIGAASLFLAAGITAATRGIRFSFNPSPEQQSERQRCVLIIFVIAGLPKRLSFADILSKLRAREIGLVGVLVTSVPFALAHLYNPNVSRGFTFVNTVFAEFGSRSRICAREACGFRLACTGRELDAGCAARIPVSGIERIAPAPRCTR